MILFVNTFITNENPNFKLSYQRGNLNTDDKLDIFKYSLASLAIAYDWSKVILKISLDNHYKQRQDELEQFIKVEFSKFDLIIEWKRNEYQNDWKKLYSGLMNISSH